MGTAGDDKEQRSVGGGLAMGRPRGQGPLDPHAGTSEASSSSSSRPGGEAADDHGTGPDGSVGPDHHGYVGRPRRTGRLLRWARSGRETIVRWRAMVRRTPTGRIVWRVAVGLVGGVVLLVGVISIPGPGQGWAIVFVGLAILSTEFEWAHRLRLGLWHRLEQAREWYRRRDRATRWAVAIGTAVAVAAIVLAAGWLSLSLFDVPGWLPEPLAGLLSSLPGVEVV